MKGKNYVTIKHILFFVFQSKCQQERLKSKNIFMIKRRMNWVRGGLVGEVNSNTNKELQLEILLLDIIWCRLENIK